MPKKKYGARKDAKFLKPGASREETGMAQRAGTARKNIRTIVRVPKNPTMEFDDRLTKIRIKRKR